jgi:N-methylhydantoinase A
MPIPGPVRIAVDVGGTFTDLQILEEETGATHAVKTPTTPDDPSIGLAKGLKLASKSLDFPLSRVTALMHGTTIATNAVLQQRLAKAALVTTAGFEDVLEIGRHVRKDVYANRAEERVLLIPRRRRFGLKERMRADGSIETEPRPDAIQEIIDQLVAAKPEAIAVTLLHAYANPEHEIRIAEAITQAMPGIPLSLSHRICPEVREFERTSTTVLNAMLVPVIQRYLTNLQRSMSDIGLTAPIYLVQSNGGAALPETAAEQPARLLLSGPSGGALAGEVLSKALNEPNLIGVDMGGTSYDVSLVVDGAVRQIAEGEVDGCPVRLPMVEIRTIGAGGGSIARVEDGGRLRVGPDSAGAEPGPVCYGRGGLAPTVTDANLVLGRIDPGFFLGGGMKLDLEGARAAVQDKVAAPLGLDIDEAAEGIVRVAVSAMAAAIRLSLFEKGLDPRDFALVSFGGAGGLHACDTVTELGATRVIFPRDPGTLSAWGMLSSDLVHDLARSKLMLADESAIPALVEIAKSLFDQGTAALDADGVTRELRALPLSLDLRYPGQGYEIAVPLTDAGSVAKSAELFHQAHHAQYAHSETHVIPEIVTVRCAATGRLAKPRPRPFDTSGTGGPKGTRSIAAEGSRVDMPVYDRDSLAPGARVSGPAIVEEAHSTLYLPPGWTLAAAPSGDLIGTRDIGEAS